MSIAHIEKFAELINNDPALLARVRADVVITDDPTDVESMKATIVSNSVAVAKSLGLEFTEEEARSWLDNEFSAAASGELSNSQLDAVAGGGAYIRYSNDTEKQMVMGYERAKKAVIDWFSSW